MEFVREETELGDDRLASCKLVGGCLGVSASAGFGVRD